MISFLSYLIFGSNSIPDKFNPGLDSIKILLYSAVAVARMWVGPSAFPSIHNTFWRNFMKKHIFFSIILSVILLAGFSNQTNAAPQSTEFDALIGTWDIELTDAGMVMEFVFKMEEDTLVGEMIFEMGGGVMENIVFEDNKLSFSLTVDAGGQTVGVDATATVDGDTMVGYMDTDMGGSDFTGTKKKEQ